MTPWTGKTNIRIAFETYSAFGNPLFIDNVEIGQFVDLDEQTNADEDVLIYPNPTQNRFNVRLKAPEKFGKIELYNHLGQLVYAAKLDKSSQSLQINRANNWKSGMYYLTVSGGEHRVVRKVNFY